ncbi:MAG: hypothetical protein N2201_04070 [candidate division WOR-3 bacterium]|nr:hypothetical protein [candidate division WOR-3 bacterium]
MYRIIIISGVLTYVLLLLAILTGRRFIRLGLQWHIRIAIAAIILASIHAIFVIYLSYI